MLHYLYHVVWATLGAFVATLVIRACAAHFGLVDRPDGRRKTHKKPIPLGGGLAIAVGFAVGAAMSLRTIPGIAELLVGQTGYLIGLALAAAIVVGVGLVDDRVGLRGRQKLAGQAVAVAVLMACSGMLISKVRFLNLEIEFGVFAIPITLLWLLGAINSVNLLDGIDGLATTLGVIFALALSAMCLANERTLDAVMALALVGSLVGFIRFNLPPASIFLGDAGSMLIGLLVGAMALHSSLKGPATMAFAAPLAILTIPLMDTTAAVIRRKLTGRSIYSTDRGHMHHALMSKGFSNRATLLVISAGAIVTCGAAFASIYLNNELLAGISILVVIALAVSLRLFGHAEFVLLRTRLLELSRSIMARGKNAPNDRESAVQIQGTRSWDELWHRLRQRTLDMVIRLKLDIDVPRLHEGYHARWERIGNFDDVRSWDLSLAIVHQNHVVGKMEIAGLQAGADPDDGLFHAMALLHFVQAEAAKLLDQEQAPEGSSGELALTA